MDSLHQINAPSNEFLLLNLVSLTMTEQFCESMCMLQCIPLLNIYHESHQYAICVPCFQNGNHKDRDYSVIYTGGGYCDCGDVTAWKREDFYSKHKGVKKIQPLAEEFAKSVRPVLDMVLVYLKNKLLFAKNVFGISRTARIERFHAQHASKRKKHLS
ncbi:unnamed protein product, partial [Vitis vinifera]|uniref:E3 ubiquitin-protein ligase n=1 Tax=Vitis vinifera TaxID=29760 RepID=D7T077_VITVI